MGNLCCCNKKIRNNEISPHQSFLLWKNELFLDPDCKCMIKIIFENDLYYVEGSMFYEKEPNEPIGLKIYRKSNNIFGLSNEKTNEICSICLENLQNKKNKDYVVLPCQGNHKFHLSCFEKYMNVKREQETDITCPLCRSSLSNGDDAEIYRLKAIERRN